MRHALAVAALLTAFALPAVAQDTGFTPIRDKSTFMAGVAERDLRLAVWNVQLRVESDGEIRGKAMGKEVTGTWEWKNGQFCRSMAWGEKAIPHNCQLVEASPQGRVRFTTDNGAGESAVFRIN